LSALRGNDAPSVYANKEEPTRSTKEDAERIKSDVDAFLAKGGEITKIPKGQSGWRPTVQIVINPLKQEGLKARKKNG